MEYQITARVRPEDFIYQLPTYEEVDFMLDCYNTLSYGNDTNFLRSIGIEEIVDLLDEDTVIEELNRRGYKITKDE